MSGRIGKLASERLRMTRDAEIPLKACPQCGQESNRATYLNEPGVYATPVAGDTTVCSQCTAWLVFVDDLSMRLMRQDEIRDLSETERAMLVNLTRALVRIHELQAQRPKVR